MTTHPQADPAGIAPGEIITPLVLDFLEIPSAGSA